MSWLEATNQVAQIVALLGAGGYFGYKAASGYEIVDLSLSLQCQRSARAKTDLLCVSVALNKGQRGRVRIHDAAIRVRAGKKTVIVPLIGAERLSFLTREGEGADSLLGINWEQRSHSAPLLSLSPGERTELAAMAEVAPGQPCTVEAVILGRRDFSEKTGQWRASAVVAPLDTNP